MTVVKSCRWSSSTLLVPKICLILSRLGLILNPLANSAGIDNTDWDIASSFTFSSRPILVSTCSDWVDFSLECGGSKYNARGCKLISEFDGLIGNRWSYKFSNDLDFGDNFSFDKTRLSWGEILFAFGGPEIFWKNLELFSECKSDLLGLRTTPDDVPNELVLWRNRALSPSTLRPWFS